MSKAKSKDNISDFALYYKPGKSWIGKIGAVIYVMLEPGFVAIVLYRISHYFFTKKLNIFALFVMRMNKFLTHVDISYQCTIGQALRLPHCSDIVIGATAVIGDNVEILNGVTLGAVELRKEGKRHPTIKDRVVIGSGAKVLGNITIKDGACIGANAVVLHDVAENTTVVGIPAKPIFKKASS